MDGRAGWEYAGGYSDYVEQHAPAAPCAARGPGDAGADEPGQHAYKQRTASPPRLSFKERRELAALPASIERLEAEQQSLQAQLFDPAFYQRAGAAIGTARERLAALEGAIASAYDRWQQLQTVADDAETSG